MSRSGSGRRDHKGMTHGSSPGNDGWINVGGSSSQRKDKVGDLSKFGSMNRGKISGNNFSLAPGGLTLSGGAKGWKSDNKADDHKTTVLSRTNSTSNTYSILESSEGRKSSESSTSEAPKPSPPTERKKLNLAPRTKPITPEEPQAADKSTPKSNSEMASSEQPMSEDKAVKKINNMMEEYFSVLDIKVCILWLYFRNSKILICLFIPFIGGLRMP
jgi:translation initiation factor 4G